MCSDTGSLGWAGTCQRGGTGAFPSKKVRAHCRKEGFIGTNGGISQGGEETYDEGEIIEGE